MEGRNAALLTLSYLGAVRVMPSYNVMGLAKASLEANVRFMASSLGKKGIRVNAISAGPIKTLAASGIGNFGKLLGYADTDANGLATLKGSEPALVLAEKAGDSTAIQTMKPTRSETALSNSAGAMAPGTASSSLCVS